MIGLVPSRGVCVCVGGAHLSVTCMHTYTAVCMSSCVHTGTAICMCSCVDPLKHADLEFFCDLRIAKVCVPWLDAT